MPAIIDYIIKLSICLAVVYLFYQLFLRRLTFYNWNRWYLLGYSALSFIIPVIDIMPQLQKREMDSNAILQWIPVFGAPVVEKNFFETLSYWDWALIIIVTGTLVFLVRFLTKLISFLLLKKKATLISSEQTLLYQLNENITPFSFGNAIYINRHLHTEAELQEIIRHEFVHVKQNHTLDIIFCELLCILNWFNPFAWLIRHSVKQNLEFIADDKVVQNGFDKKEYQYLLLKVMGNKQFAFTNHFNFSNLKKRIKMMNTLKTAKVHLIKFLFLLPVVAVLLLSFRKEIQKVEVKRAVAIVKDTVPISDSGYKISVITSSGNSMNSKMNDQVIDRMSLEDWNKNKEFYEKKYGKPGVIDISERKDKEGLIVRFDSVYVMKTKPKPIKPGEEPLIIVDGKQIPYTEMNSVSPDDIKSISVLKNSPSTTSEYGEKGKNGVIIIATEKGLKGTFQKDDAVYNFLTDSVSIDDKGVIRLMGNPSGIIMTNKEKERRQPGFIDSLKGKLVGLQIKPTNPEEIIARENIVERVNNEAYLNIDASQRVPKIIGETIVVQHHEITDNAVDLKSSTMSIKGKSDVLFVLDGKEITQEQMGKVKPEAIDAIVILKDKSATEKYGHKGKNGAIEIETKKPKEK